MTKIASSVIACSFLLALSTSAQALNTRSFISANGVDTNPCTRTAPCRTLQKAHDSTNPGGEVNMLDPAGYGIVTITKSISIVNDGVGSAGILVPAGQNGITINAGASDVINLRGLIIEGAGTGNDGIQFNTGDTLNIQNSVLRRFSNEGINFQPSASSKLFVSNTLVSDNGGIGIDVSPIGAGITVTASLNRVEADNNGSNGIRANGSVSTGTVKVTVADSVAANNSDGFLSASTGGAATAELMLVRCIVINNSFYGIRAFGTNATVRAAQSTVTGNGSGWDASVGTLFTYGDNYVNGNASNEAAQTPLATK